MAKNVKLLLTETVDSLGIPGDVVNVRLGFARNFLLPRALATTPSDELIKSLSAKRAQAEKELAEQRKQRETTSQKLQGFELELVRSCNDQGVLYGAITQQDVASMLSEKGYSVKPREVRLPGSIKRVDKYEVHVKLGTELDAIVRLVVKPDRELPKEAEEGVAAAGLGAGGGRRDAMAEIEAADKARVVGWGGGEKKGEAAAAAAEGDKKPKGKKDASEPKGEAKPDKKADKPEKGEKKADKAKK